MPSQPIRGCRAHGSLSPTAETRCGLQWTWFRLPGSHFFGSSVCFALASESSKINSSRPCLSQVDWCSWRAMFVSAAVSGALIESLAARNIDGETYYFGRHIIDALLNTFAMKMAGVFMISTCTIALRTLIFPRWLAYLGYACALVLLLVIGNWRWITLVFPIWMLLVSGQILAAEFRSRHAGSVDAEN